MKNIYKLFLSFLSFLTLSISSSAQIYPARFSEFSFVFKADSNSRSVLLSNVVEDQSGNQSTIIGTAGWTEIEKQFQCRSLLYFDYGDLPQMLQPDEIVKAQLVLVPLQITSINISNDDIRFAKFRVRRVTKPWTESEANWSNQPLTNIKDEVTKRIDPAKKDQVVKIDVTRQVKNMFRYGNNGFMIQFEDSLTQGASFSHWFASTKIADKDLRPVLLITYSVYQPAFFGDSWASPGIPLNQRQDIQNDLRIIPLPKTVAPTEPVKEPVKEQPVKDQQRKTN